MCSHGKSVYKVFTCFVCACKDTKGKNIALHSLLLNSLLCLSIVQYLISYNPELMLCKDSEERTSLHTACQHGQTEVVNIHIQNLKKVTDINLFEVIDANGNTPLHLACERESKAVVQLLVDHGGNITAVNIKGETSVHTAAQHKSVEIMKLLLDKEVNTLIELKDHCGCTPLHHAAENNQPEIIKYLYEW